MSTKDGFIRHDDVMIFRTVVEIPPLSFSIAPCEEMLFVGSCFADSIGRRFQEEKFRVVVNPYGVMYNPASIMHTVSRFLNEPGRISPKVVVFTLGTNHVYVLKETGEIVDNCQKRPQKLFEEQAEKYPTDNVITYCNRCTLCILTVGVNGIHLMELAMGTYGA